MSLQVPRLRMFAGPNGSGKSTVKNGLPQNLFDNYINPDELEKTMRIDGAVDLTPFGIRFSTSELRQAFRSSELLKANHMVESAEAIDSDGHKIDFTKLEVNSYHASVFADTLRRKLIESSISFTFETVMSSPDKIDLLRHARALGYRTYLYFVSTSDPATNIARVRNRVAEGGHDVPIDKIVARHQRTLELLREAIRFTNRAYFFDTSEERLWFAAEITDGKEIDLKSDEMPNWFKQYVWDRF